jgi:adenylate cyclase
MRLRRFWVALAIAGGATFAAHGLTAFRLTGDILSQLDLRTLDYRMRAAADPPRERSSIVLVLFDSTTVESWPYLSPFPRAVIADLIEVASAGGASVIGVDVHLDRLYPQLDVFGPGDERLRTAIAAAGNVVLPGATSGTAEQRAFSPPHSYFAEVAANLAVADLPTPFETVRDGVLTVATDSGRVPGFALALYAAAKGIAPDSIARLGPGDHLPIPGLPDRYSRIPSDAVQTVPILFAGPPSRTGRDDGAFVTVPAAYAHFLPGLFHDKVVLIGTGYHEQDRFRSPFYEHQDADGEMYGWINGVEVHANALENLLTARFPVPLSTSAALLLLFSISLAVVGMTFLRGAGWGATAATGLWLALAVGAFVIFQARSVHIPIVAPTAAVVFAFLASTGYVSRVEGREKRLIRRAFTKYVSPALVDQLMADPARLRLGGEKRDVTILFSDLEGFTSLSETSNPERLLALLNRYLDQMSEILLAEGGTLDKYIGDAVMALFGAPLPQKDHALRACRTALLMQRRLEELNAEWRTEGWAGLRMRIGINTGTPIVGNIGGDKRFDYTALGDAVNLAARLEPACKRYGVSIVISEGTREAAGDAIVARDLDMLTVHGKALPVRVFELMGLAGETNEYAPAPPPEERDLVARSTSN